MLVCSRTPDDVHLCEEFATYLAPSERSGRITVWHEGLAPPGSMILAVLDTELGDAAVVVVLLTPHVLADVNRMALIEKYHAVGIRLVAVLCRACAWAHSSLSGLALLPRDHRTPVALWPDRGLAWSEVLAAADPLAGVAVEEVLPPNNLPSRRLFVGRRRDLEELQVRLSERRIAGVTPRASVYGLGGVGKTSLALEHAYAHANAYLGGLFWVHAHGDPISALLAFSVELRAVAPPAVAEVLVASPSGDAKTIAATVRLAMQRNPLPSLLVLDNIDSDWSAHLPAGMVRVLITSRDPDCALGDGMRLDVLDEGDALALAAEIAGACEGADAAARSRVVMTELGGIAVAVEMAARAVKRWTKTWLQYEVTLVEQSSVLLGDNPRLFGEHGREYKRGALAALDWSIQRCQDGTARALLESLAALAPERALIDWVEAGAGAQADALETVAAWDLLVETGLVKLDHKAAEATLHRLVHRWLVETTVQEARDNRASAMAETLRAWLEKTVDIGRIPEVEARRQHIETVLLAIERGGKRTAWIDIADGLAKHLWHRGAYNEARSMCERTLVEAERLEPPDEERVAGQLSNLALLMRNLGDKAAARPLFERVLAIDERIRGPEHANVAIDLSNLAGLLLSLGDPSGARPLAERALAIDENALGSEHPKVAIRLSGLAGALRDLGDAAGARPLAERALAIDEKALGSDHPHVAIRLANLARVLRDLGDVPGARLQLGRALAIAEKRLDPEHPISRKLRDILADLGPSPEGF